MSDKPRSDNYNMTAHKMLWHMDRVLEHKKGRRIAPLHIDAGISRGCNIACHYCFGKTQGNLFKEGIDQYLAEDVLVNFFRDAGEIGVRSIAVIGEAEPLVNPHVYRAIVEGKKAGVDMSLATNGILFTTKPVGVEALEHLTWIRFNLSAASLEGYQRVHGSRAFDAVLDKIRYVVRMRKEHRLGLTIGIQMVLTPLCLSEAVGLARLSRELEVDYLVIKQCSDLRSNALGVYQDLPKYTSQEFTETLQEAESYSTDGFKVIVKWPQIGNMGVRSYPRCLGAPFLLHTTGDGRVYSCASFFDGKKDQYLLGDLTRTRFRDIVASDRYWDAIARLQREVDTRKECYSNCRTNNINQFLWEFENPPEHLNFV